MVELPTGTVTFLFTDLEVSTRLWDQEPEAMRNALARHDAILRDAVARHEGHVVKGRGDGVHAVFATAEAAVRAAIDTQVIFDAEQWTVSEPLRVRIGIHTGAAELRDGDYFGSSVNRAARVMDLAHGGQTVMSLATQQLVRDSLPADVTVVDLGSHHLRDLGLPEQVFQVSHSGLPHQFPALRSPDHVPSELPVALTSFVGRERELQSVVDALRHSRIVTLIGVGGIGKTRLAVEAAAEVASDYPDGTWFCALAGVSDRAAVSEAVAARLGLGPQPGESPVANLVSFLRAKKLLLVLDNCEHVIDAAGSLTEALVRGCPDVTVLATSREALVAEGEVLRPLRSLAVPEEQATPLEAAGVPAVQLFADRARAVRPEFALDETTTPVVADICRQLDGMPLAIELAAARVGALTVGEIARRLDQRFRLLTGGRRTALERHQTLRGAVDWSYELLDELEARVFGRAAAFAGGFVLDAAEVVLSGDGIETDDVIELLSRLVARSMIEADEANGATRYRLHETMRQYGRERLDASGEADAVRRRHAEYFVALAERARSEAFGPDEENWIRVVFVEFPNFRAAFDWAFAIGDADLALRLTVSIGAFAVPRPHYSVARWLAQALDMPGAGQHRLRPDAATWLAHSEMLLSSTTASLIEHGRLMDDAFAQASAEFTVEAHGYHAIVASRLGQYDQALAHATAAVDLAAATGDPREAFYNASAANFLTRHGDLEGALDRAERGVALASQLASPSQLAPAENALGQVLSFVDPEQAIPHLEAAWSISEDIGNEVLPHMCAATLAKLAANRGDVERALDIYAELLGRTATLNNPLFAVLDCERLAVALADTGHLHASATILAALNNPAMPQFAPLPDRRATSDLVVQGLTDLELEQCTQRGQHMDPDSLIGYARTEVARIQAETAQTRATTPLIATRRDSTAT
jgi:predicted ATPase/class 3 adenylate cyclase